MALVKCLRRRRRVARREVLDPAAIEQVDRLRAQLLELTFGHALHWPGPRQQCVAGLKLDSMPQFSGMPGGAPPRTSAYWAFNAENAWSSAPRGAAPRPQVRRTRVAVQCRPCVPR